MTGAAGSLASKLILHMRATWPSVEIIGLDRIAAEGGRTCDLQDDPALWQDHFNGADAVIHLAGNGDSGASWQELIRSNVDATLYVYAAAARAGVRHVVLASSVWTMAGRRFMPGTIAADPLPDPGTNAYGATKLFAERVAAAYAATHGISTVVLRIGGCPPAPNRPGDNPPMPDWNEPCWLSDGDFVRGVVSALTADVEGVRIVNLVSANGDRWSMAEARDALGFEPRDGHAPVVTWRRRVRANAVKVATVSGPRLLRRLLPSRWT